MKYQIMHKTKPHFLLAICCSPDSAQRWIERFDPRMWMDKDMVKSDLAVIPVPYGDKRKCRCPICNLGKAQAQNPEFTLFNPPDSQYPIPEGF